MTAIKYKQELSNSIADTLETACSKVSRALAARLRLCNNSKNLFLAKDLHNADFELFDGEGSLWCCNSRLCSFCVAKLAKRSRKIANYIIENQPKKHSHKWRFVVLTMPDDALIGLSLYKQRQVFNDAWRWLSTKSEWFKKTIDGCIKTEEFTVDVSRLNIFHYHINLLTYSAFPSESRFKTEWTEALKHSFKKHNVAWHCPTSNGLANVYMKLVVDYRIENNHSTKISEQAAVFELCKYVTKAQSWEQMPIQQLAEVAENPRFWRMFEVLGSCRQTAKPIRPNAAKKAVKTALNVIISNAIINSNLNGYTYFNNKCITVLNFFLKIANQSNAPPKTKKLSWIFRIQNGITTLTDYTNELENDFVKARKFRVEQLRKKYIYATFKTFDGYAF